MVFNYNILFVSAHPERMDEEIRFLEERNFTVTPLSPDSGTINETAGQTTGYDSILLGPAGEDQELYLKAAADIAARFSAPLIFFSERTDESFIDRFNKVRHKGVITRCSGPALLKSHLIGSIKSQSESLFSNSPIALLLKDRESRIIRFNRKAEEITGYREEELKGKIFDLRNRKSQLYSAAENEYIIISKEGREKIIELYTMDLRDNSEAISEQIEGFIDITERKEHQNFHSDMEKVIHHDLKTPLNSIIGFPKIMLTDKNLPAEYREYLMIILLSGQNMLNLINASLNLYRIEEGTYQFNREKTDVLSQLLQVKSILKEDCRKKRTEILLLMNGEPFPEKREFTIFTEKSLFNSILVNLVKNAVEASPPDEAITVELTGNEEHPEIAIHNKGIIPEQIRDRFFEKNVTMGKKDGNGLGTYSAKLMARAINIDVSYKTAEKEGTTLFLKL